jgi:flagellar protein FliS
MELNNTLDHKVGGDVAKNLEQLYMYITEQYTKSNITGSSEPLKSSLKVLETLYDGWVQAVEKIKKEESEKLKNAKP